jgi:hypothetical protein
LGNLFQKISDFVLPLDLDRNSEDPRRGGAPIRAVRQLMKDAWVYWTALAIAYLGAGAASASLASEQIRNEIALVACVVETLTAALLFFRCIFDARFRSGFATAHRQIIANQRRTRGQRRIFDPYWGMFSPYNGPLPSRIASPMLLIAFLLVAWFGGKGWGDIVYLLFASFFVAGELVMLFVGLNTEPDSGLW